MNNFLFYFRALKYIKNILILLSCVSLLGTINCGYIYKDVYLGKECDSEKVEENIDKVSAGADLLGPMALTLVTANPYVVLLAAPIALVDYFTGGLFECK